MTAHEHLARMKRRLGITVATEDALLTDLITDAVSMTLAYTGQAAIPDLLNGAVTDIAVMMYNRIGAEGKGSHSEGGISITVDTLPASLKRQLDAYRVCHIVSMLSPLE